jgi:hypothetical protein
MANYRVKNKAKAAHKPPARVRYEQSHPTVSCRLSKDEYELLKQRLDDLGGVSFADFVKDSLGLLQLKIPDTKEIKEKARRAGYDQGKSDHQIWYFCAVCGKRVDVEPNNDSHSAIIRLMRQEGWGHKSCHRR